MDPYVYPGTDILRNLRDIRDQAQLSRFEMDMTSLRLVELSRSRKPGSFDASHLQAIHCHLFQDVYDWAGEFRTVNIFRSGDPFAFHEYIVPSLDRTFVELRKERHLGGSNARTFSARSAYYLGEINAIHPFRDGNGRAQREFIRQLASRNGFALDWSCVTRDQMYEASRQSFSQADYSGLEVVIQSALSVDTPRPWPG